MSVVSAALEEDPLPRDVIVSGSPRRFETIVATGLQDRVRDGIYRLTPGRFKDVQVGRESMVVVQGSATVELPGGEFREVSAGDWVVLEDGERSTWTVHETLVGAYVQITL